MTEFRLLTVNQFGVLARIVSIISSSGANIQTVQVYPVPASESSIVHLRVETQFCTAERMGRKLSRLPQVLDVKVGEE